MMGASGGGVGWGRVGSSITKGSGHIKGIDSGINAIDACKLYSLIMEFFGLGIELIEGDEEMVEVKVLDLDLGPGGIK